VTGRCGLGWSGVASQSETAEAFTKATKITAQVTGSINSRGFEYLAARRGNFPEWQEMS